MSTLTALKLERELEITRRAMAQQTARPRLELRWGLDSETGRPAAVWMVAQPSAVVTVLPELAFA
jgi:hypothetical protein